MLEVQKNYFQIYNDLKTSKLESSWIDFKVAWMQIGMKAILFEAWNFCLKVLAILLLQLCLSLTS